MFIDPQAVTLPLAFLGGLFSFISPCVLPLVPAYVGYLTGQAANSASNNLAAATVGADGELIVAAPNRWLIFSHGVFFVFGFSTIFVLLFGFTAGLLGSLALQVNINSQWLLRIGGLLIIVLGLHTMGVIRIPFLYYDTRKQVAPKQELGYAGSYLMGLTFAAGWSPCLGPILSALLGLAATTGNVGQSTLLLTVYALGLGVPFLLTAFFMDRATNQLNKLKKHMKTIEMVSGLLLIVIGVIIFTGRLQSISGYFAQFTGLTETIDAWLVNIAGGGN